jgi:hypothetical protein
LHSFLVTKLLTPGQMLSVMYISKPFYSIMYLTGEHICDVFSLVVSMKEATPCSALMFSCFLLPAMYSGLTWCFVHHYNIVLTLPTTFSDKEKDGCTAAYIFQIEKRALLFLMFRLLYIPITAQESL